MDCLAKKVQRRWLALGPAFILMVVMAAAVLASCGESSPATSAGHVTVPAAGGSDTKATDIVREYFASTAATFPHVAIEKIEVSGAAGERSLYLELRSDGADEADGELYGICMESDAPDGWVDRLNRNQNLGLVSLHIVVNYPTGAPDSMTVDVKGHALSSSSGAPRFSGHPPVASPTSSLGRPQGVA